ncbi:protein S-acyltransferase 10 isoform X2 [Diospyros lotus]|uniref:protein S-acyltransferase 10 isoform X2 n=1 Tax=Diospyros lotus TaxID=55363 RepID=UPI00225B27D8|nr:protein S-acyltransferase 10 isoform X2 [Diospyros lotus]
MTMVGLRDGWNCAFRRCLDYFPSLSDPARRSSLCLKLALVMIHLIYVGVLFLFDKDLVAKTKQQPYTGLYLFLFVATLVQYFLTAGSSPGYVLDAMRVANQADNLLRKTSMTMKQPASSRNVSVVFPVDGNQLGRNLSGNNPTTWTKLVMEMYPPGSSPRQTDRYIMPFLLRSLTCSYCNVLPPPRARHCHDCDKCVLEFDHHCVWLGTCVGQGNHCRFWWYIFEETGLCTWTGILYITYLKVNISKAWWIDVIMIFLLVTLSMCFVFLLLLVLFHSFLVLTNQTTYELARRRRIPYLRGIPERVHPYSKGACRNLYNFCCTINGTYSLEPLPSQQELDEKSKPYTCMDVLSCRCCC